MTHSIKVSPATCYKPRATCHVLRATCALLSCRPPFALLRLAISHKPRAASQLPFIILVTLLVLSATSFVNAQQPVKLALLPFENISGSIDSIPIIMPLVEQTLKEKGYRIISPGMIEPFLAKNRIRNTGMLSRSQLDSLRREFGVEMALVGSVDLFYQSEDNPQWGVSARLVSTSEGDIVWADSTGRTGGDFTRILGLGTITSGVELARQVVKILFQTLPPQASRLAVPESAGYRWEDSFGDVPSLGAPAPGPQRKESKKVNLFGAKGGYRSQVLDSLPRWRVAVATFENFSERRGAGRILADVLTTALYLHGGFQVVDPGELHEALIALERTPYGGIDRATLVALKKRTGVDAIFLGTVYRYSEGLKQGATSSPEISLDIRMLDAETGKILWFASSERTGDEYQIVLDFGIIRSIVPLILRVMEEMLATL